MTNNADLDQLASSELQKHWSGSTSFADMVSPGSAGLGFKHFQTSHIAYHHTGHFGDTYENQRSY